MRFGKIMGEVDGRKGFYLLYLLYGLSEWANNGFKR